MCSNKQKLYATKILNMYTNRNIKSNPDLIKTLWENLQKESEQTINSLFEKMKYKNYYSDFDKTVPRMPIIPEWIEAINRIKEYEFQYKDIKHLPMSEKEGERKKQYHYSQCDKIKAYLAAKSKDKSLSYESFDKEYELKKKIKQEGK